MPLCPKMPISLLTMIWRLSFSSGLLLAGLGEGLLSVLRWGQEPQDSIQPWPQLGARLRAWLVSLFLLMSMMVHGPQPQVTMGPGLVWLCMQPLVLFGQIAGALTADKTHLGVTDQ